MAVASPNLFVAFILDPDNIKRVRAATREWTSLVEFVPLDPADMHVTLAFLGPAMEHAGLAALETAAGVVPSLMQFDDYILRMSADRLDMFGGGRALVLRLTGSMRLASIRDAALAAAGCKPERDYRPHLTLAKSDVIVTDETRARVKQAAIPIELRAIRFRTVALGLYRRATDQGPRRYDLLKKLELPTCRDR